MQPTYKEKQGIKAVNLYTENGSLSAESYVYSGGFVILVVGSKRKTWLLLTVGRESEKAKEDKELPYPRRKRVGRGTGKNFHASFPRSEHH